MFLTHFTDLKSAFKIIHDNRLKVNERGYLSLTELSPLEFFTITQSKRKYGFAFFKEDLLAQRRDLYSPIAYSQESNLVKQLQLAPRRSRKNSFVNQPIRKLAFPL